MCSARWRRSVRQIPRSLFPQRTDRGHAHHAGRPFPARAHGEFLGRRHGADPVHADQRGRLAIDFSGDGKADIWSNVPDVLGSTANYLAKEHWKRGLPWGFEVMLPKGFDMMRSHASFAEWTKLGLRRADGKPFPAEGEGILFFPSGAKGPAFVVSENYAVLKEYNNSDAYAIAVGHLADRMHGGGPSRRRGRPTTVRCRATRASPCRKNSAASATRCSTSKAMWISTCATISAPNNASSACCRMAIQPWRCWRSSA